MTASRNKDEPLLPLWMKDRLGQFRFPKPTPVDIGNLTLEKVCKTTRVVCMRTSECARTCQTEHGSTMYDKQRREGVTGNLGEMK
jgi:hypothetical protein